MTKIYETIPIIFQEQSLCFQFFYKYALETSNSFCVSKYFKLKSYRQLFINNFWKQWIQWSIPFVWAEISYNLGRTYLTFRRPLRRKLQMSWSFHVSKVKESSCCKSDLTDPPPVGFLENTNFSPSRFHFSVGFIWR